MDVRQADYVEDFERCAALSDSVQSSHVWQLRLAYDPIAAAIHEELGATLHRTRLPRPVTIKPASRESLEAMWERALDVLVAENAEGIAGYVVLTSGDYGAAISIARLVVAPQQRRSGIGGRLVGATLEWCRASGVATLVGHCSTRNDPAARFFMRWGLRFAGYSEAFYPHGEVALFWQRAV